MIQGRYEIRNVTIYQKIVSPLYTDTTWEGTYKINPHLLNGSNW